VGVTVLLPSLLATEAGGQKRFELEAATVGEALRALPVANLLFDEHGALRPLVNVYVDGTDARWEGGVDRNLAGGETLRIVQAVAGG
jgi:molybdopterin converting factor small subunit